MFEHSEEFTKDGIRVITPDENVGVSSSPEEAKWKIVTQIIEDYTKVHPQEMKEDLTIARALRESMAGHQSQSSVRWGFRCSPGIVRLIERKFPDFFTDPKTITAFMKRFPGFVIADSV